MEISSHDLNKNPVLSGIAHQTLGERTLADLGHSRRKYWPILRRGFR